MQRAREIVGLPVLDIQSGNQVGWVQDIVFDEQEDQVLGLTLEGGHFFQPDKGIPRSSIVSIGKDALTVNGAELQQMKGVKWSQKLGNQVYTQGGEAKGTVEDVFLDDATERITGFEVSDGLFADLFVGRGAVSEQQVVVDGKDVLIVADEATPWGQNDEGGLKS